MNAQAESARVRAELLRLPGAMRCTIGGCTVITQGGGGGMAKHIRVVHR